MFGKSAEDKAAEKQAKQEAKDKAAMEKFGRTSTATNCIRLAVC